MPPPITFPNDPTPPGPYVSGGRPVNYLRPEVAELTRDLLGRPDEESRRLILADAYEDSGGAKNFRTAALLRLPGHFRGEVDWSRYRRSPTTSIIEPYEPIARRFYYVVTFRTEKGGVLVARTPVLAVAFFDCVIERYAYGPDFPLDEPVNETALPRGFDFGRHKPFRATTLYFLPETAPHWRCEFCVARGFLSRVPVYEGPVPDEVRFLPFPLVAPPSPPLKE